MRSDLSANFLAELGKQGRRPVQLLELRFAAGTRYVSDRAVGVADGLAHDYEPLVLEWGELQDTTDPGAVLRGGTIDARQMSVTLWNGGDDPLSAEFSAEHPENVQVYLYQWFEGMAEADKALLDILLIQDPIAYGQASNQLSLDLVSLHLGADPLLGYVLGKAAFPNAEEYGFGVPVLFGQVSRAKTFLSDMGLMGTLADETTHNATSIVLNEDVSGWPSSGTLFINFEKISYTSRSGSTFSGCTRGASSTLAAQHPGGREVFLVGDYYEFAACEGPVTAIDKVYRNGVEITTGFTKLASSNPARVRFVDCLPNTHTFGPTVRREMALTSVDSFLNTSGTADPTVALLDKPGSYITCGLGDWQQVSFDNSYLSSAGRLKRVRFKVTLLPLNCAVEYYISVVRSPGVYDIKAHGVQPKTNDYVTMVVDFEMEDPAAWSEFLTREVRCRWWPVTGQTCRVHWMRFEFEYEEKIKVYTRDITLDLTQTSGGIKPDVAISDLLTDKLGLGGFLDTTAFAAAQAKLDALGYRFNGLIAGDVTAQEALRKMLFQSRTRLVGNSGAIKLVVKEPVADKTVVANVLNSDVREKCLAVARQPVADVVNRINCTYSLTLSGEAEGNYAGLDVREDTDSQDAFGQHETEMALDLITSQAVAQDLADYYLNEWAWPGSFVTYEAYLPHIRYEKEDALVLKSTWNRFDHLPGILLGATRVFGNGNTGQINLCRCTLFCRPDPQQAAALADGVDAADIFNGWLDPTGYGAGGFGAGGYGA